MESVQKSSLHRTWRNVAFGVFLGAQAGALATVAVQYNSTLRETWNWAISDGTAVNFWQMMMALEGLVAVPAGIIGVTEHFRLRRKELEEAIQKREAEQAVEEQRRADKLEDQRIEKDENSLELRKGHGMLEEALRAQHRWYADKKAQVFEWRLRYPGEEHKVGIDAMEAYFNTTHYSNLVSLFEQGYIDFYEPNDPEYAEYWDAREGDINQMLANPDFRKQVDDLLTEDTNKDFRQYMKAKIAALAPPEDIPAHIAAAQARHAAPSALH